VLIVLFVCGSCTNSSRNHYRGWEAYAGGKDGIRYSSNDQINQNNVKQLRVAWSYQTPDSGQMQCNPIVIDGTLYGVTASSKMFAVDAATGRQKWIFDPTAAKPGAVDGIFVHANRGVAYWEDRNKHEKRILYSAGPWLFSIDAEAGQPDLQFGDSGSIDMKDDLDRQFSEKGFIKNTSPGIIYKDLLILGSSVAESADALPGHIRAFDVRTGKRRWIFHTIPHPGEHGYETWKDKDAWKSTGGANSWGGMSLDEKRGIVYVSTGSAAPDFYGARRKGQDLFANCVIALEAATGKYLWHSQAIHHDLWDWDLPANANLVTVTHDGKRTEAVAQITKHGYIFLFDRETGKPLFPVEEKPVAESAVPGEEAWPTQPVPALPEAFARQRFTEEDLSDLNKESHQYLLEKYRSIRNHSMFDPPAKEGSIVFPGFDGGGEWSGSAFDPETGVLYVNSKELPSVATIIESGRSSVAESVPATGHDIYNANCIGCHGASLQGNGSTYPSLVNIGKRYSSRELRRLIQSGRNMMPSFNHLPDDNLSTLIEFLLRVKKEKAHVVADSLTTDRSYTINGYEKFVDRDGYPGIKPPWGALNAVDLNTGKLLWKVPLGEVAELIKKGIPPTGTENYGGPVVTRGGLVFIAATPDSKIRAFDKSTGKILWEASLPFPGYATPCTYFLDGKQYVVIACGGQKLGSPAGDRYVAFAIP
jgi:quinoprotein glucose dehydrogenase